MRQKISLWLVVIITLLVILVSILFALLQQGGVP